MYRNKYHARKIYNEYGRFDSKLEYERFLELKALEEIGSIWNIRRQVKFNLIPSQKIDGKVVERAVTYFADFVYETSRGTVVEDAKGMRLPEYVIKRKLMLYIHGIRIKEISNEMDKRRK